MCFLRPGSFSESPGYSPGTLPVLASCDLPRILSPPMRQPIHRSGLQLPPRAPRFLPPGHSSPSVPAKSLTLPKKLSTIPKSPPGTINDELWSSDEQRSKLTVTEENRYRIKLKIEMFNVHSLFS